MPVEDPQRLASVNEAAEHAGRHQRTIRRWVRDGEIVGYRVKRKFLYVDLDEIDALLATTRIKDAS